jgi:hypothetical protein
MSSRIRRHLELLALSPKLRRYARGLQADPNASSMLVHRVLSTAFAEPPHARPSADLEASLRADMDLDFHGRALHAARSCEDGQGSGA